MIDTSTDQEHARIAAKLLQSANEAIEALTMIGLMFRETAALLTSHTALAAWACESCGARFPDPVPPVSLEGVRFCSSCMALKVVTANWTAAQQALKQLSDRHEWSLGNGPCVCEAHIEARRILANE